MTDNDAQPQDSVPQDQPNTAPVDYAALPAVDPDGPPPADAADYEVLPDGEYPQVERGVPLLGDVE